MRLKIILPVLVLGVLVVVAALLLRPGSGRLKAKPESVTEAGGNASARPLNPERLTPPPAGKRAQPVPASSALASNAFSPQGLEASHQTYVQKRVSELQDLAMDNEPASLAVILGELTNRDPEIRQAAVEAAMQFGSREAIPRLKEAAARTEDPREKAALLEASEFLKLPSPSELSGKAKGPTRR